MHDEFGNGEAFQVKNPLPLHKWIFVMLNFNRSQVKLGANWNGLNYNSVYRLVSVYDLKLNFYHILSSFILKKLDSFSIISYMITKLLFIF